MLCNVQRYLMCRQWPISVASSWARKQQEIGKEEKSLLNLTGLMLFPSEGSGLSSAKISKSKNGSNIPCCHISSPVQVCNTSTSLYAYVCAPRVGVLGGSQHCSRSCRRSLNAACSFASKLPGIEATENTDWQARVDAACGMGEFIRVYRRCRDVAATGADGTAPARQRQTKG